MSEQKLADELENLIGYSYVPACDEPLLIRCVAALRAAGSGEPVTYRWRPHGATVWIYDPEMSWFDAHRAEIDHEPLYTHPATDGEKT